MLAVIAIVIVGAVLTSVMVIAASMLSSRLSRAEDRYLADDREIELPGPEAPVGDAPQTT